ncbi:ATP-dependent DNA ligase [Paenibacillus lautus]|uniref:ATP-dependent DNA ligase n=1 Tax=Paenibacillus lautus TaxID=1401 RepID=UPI0034E964EB
MRNSARSILRLAYARHNNDCSRQYPEIANAIFPHDIVLNGEIACVDPATGNSDFKAVMTRFKAKKTDKITALAGTLPSTFVNFDVLQYNGYFTDRRQRKRTPDSLSR